MSQQLQRKLALKCLQNILMRQDQESEKDRIRGVIKKYEKSYSKNQWKQLNGNQFKMLQLLLDGFAAFRESFIEITRQQKFKAVNETQIDIVDYLLNIQTELKITKDTLTIDTIAAKYAVLNLKLKKQHDVIQKQFLTQWNVKSKEKMKKIEMKRSESSSQNTIKPAPSKNQSDSQEQSQSPIAVKQPVKVPQRRAQIQRPQPQRPQSSRRQVSQTKRQEDYRRQPQIKRQVQSRREQPRRQMASRNQTKREAPVDYNRMNKGRLLQIEKYLDSKHELKFQKAKIKEISQYISVKFDQFMRTTLQKIINIACLRNKANAKSGNQLTYFAPEANRISPELPFYTSPNSKIFMLLYKHKLQIYTQLRSKQFKKQDQLRNALEAKIPQVQKKTDKKIQNYILKPRPHDVPFVDIYQQDPEDKYSQNKIPFKPNHKKLTVGIDHFLYYLQNHNYLKNSLLLFDAYHY